MVLGLLLLSSAANSGPIGKGELTLSDDIVDLFIKYIRGGHTKAPDKFVVSNDGQWAFWWWCPAGTANCAPGGDVGDVKVCEDESNQDCGVFARRRTIKWKNGINKGKKESRFNSKWSDAEMRAKLTELGFLGEATSTEEKISTTNKGNTVEQLETLTKLYESGNLTKEEFDAAKKKILND